MAEGHVSSSIFSGLFWGGTVMVRCWGSVPMDGPNFSPLTAFLFSVSTVLLIVLMFHLAYDLRKDTVHCSRGNTIAGACSWSRCIHSRGAGRDECHSALFIQS